MIDRKIPIEFDIKKSYEVADTRFSEISVKLMVIGRNLNGSYFSKEVVKNSLWSLSNTPILAYIEDNSEGEKDCSDHRQVLTKEDGEYKIKYLGKAFGVIPETNNARFEFHTHKDGNEYEYLVVDGLLWTKFDDTIDILKRDGKKAQSMEIDEEYLGKFEKDNLFHFTSFKFYGACILGKEVQEAMPGASAELKYSIDNFEKEIQEKMEQFKQFSLQNQNSQEVDINVTKEFNEGGINMNEDEVVVVDTDDVKVDEVEVIAEETKADELIIEVVENTNDDSEEIIVTEDFEAKYNSLIAEFEVLKTENAELKEFKLSVETKEKEDLNRVENGRKSELVEKFSKVLNEETIKSFNVSELSSVELEKELKLAFASVELETKFSLNISKDSNKIPVMEDNSKTENVSPYGEAAKYFK